MRSLQMSRTPSYAPVLKGLTQEGVGSCFFFKFKIGLGRCVRNMNIELYPCGKVSTQHLFLSRGCGCLREQREALRTFCSSRATLRACHSNNALFVVVLVFLPEVSVEGMFYLQIAKQIPGGLTPTPPQSAALQLVCCPG